MDINKLKAGDKHYMAYVGPVDRYDFIGGSQFCLLFTLGLRRNDYLLDFGCGSLRAGKLFISYLSKGRYCGIEPNKWLIDEGIQNEIGREILRVKEPRFKYNDDFSVQGFNNQFNFILAQSIFSHAGKESILRALHSFNSVLHEDGIICATFVEGDEDYDGEDWVYPGIVKYRPSTIKCFANKAGLKITRLPWHHPKQSWYLFAKKKERLPNYSMKRLLKGNVLFNNQFDVSSGNIIKKQVLRFINKIVPSFFKK